MIVSSQVRSPIRGIVSSPVNKEGSGGSRGMILVMATTGASETVTIPCQNVGTFDAVIDWGDGSESIITAWNDADLAHVYADAGDHTIEITGTFPNIYFNNGGDKLKVKEVRQLGWTGLTKLNAAFYGCSNMTNFVGRGDTSQITNLYALLRDCSSATTINVSGMDTSNVTSMSYTFGSCDSVISLNLSSLDTSSVTSMSNMFVNCSSATTINVSGFDTSSVTSMSNMFLGCLGLDSLDLSNFDTSIVTNMAYMLFNCQQLDVTGIDGFDIEAVTNLTSFAQSTTISTVEYDKLLIAWAAQNAVDSLSVHFGSSKYTSGGAAETARTSLVNDDLWTITDGGAA